MSAPEHKFLSVSREMDAHGPSELTKKPRELAELAELSIRRLHTNCW